MKIRLHLAMMAAALLAAAGCAFPKAHNLPPAQQILEPGPGVGGPGPGVLPPALPAAMIPVSMPIEAAPVWKKPDERLPPTSVAFPTVVTPGPSNASRS